MRYVSLFTVFGTLLFLFTSPVSRAAIDWTQGNCAYEIFEVVPSLTHPKNRPNIHSLTEDFRLMVLQRPMGKNTPTQLQVRGLMNSGKLDPEVKFHYDIWTDDKVGVVALSPTGRWHAVGYDKDNRVELRSTEQPSNVIAFDDWDGGTSKQEIRYLLFSPDEHFLVALSYQREGVVYRLPQGGEKTGEDVRLTPLKEFEFDGTSAGVQFSPDSTALLMSTRDGNVYIMDLKESEPMLNPVLKATGIGPETVGGCFASDPRYVICGAYPDNRTMAAGGQTNSTSIKIWDRTVRDWKNPLSCLPGELGPHLRLVVPIPNSTKVYVATSGYHEKERNPPPFIDYVWDFHSNKKIDVRRREQVSGEFIFTSHAVATSDGYLFLGDVTGAIRIVKAEDGSQVGGFRLKSENEFGKRITQLHLDKKERYLVIETLDEKVRVVTLPQKE